MKRAIQVLQALLVVGVVAYVASPWLFGVQGMEFGDWLVAAAPALVVFLILEMWKRKIDPAHQTTAAAGIGMSMIALPLLFVLFVLIIAILVMQ